MDMANDILYRQPEILNSIIEERNMSEVISTFETYAAELSDTLFKKNIDYGNSIFKTGYGGILARIFDKQERIRSLLNNGWNAVEGESLRDTFHDLAGYSLLGLILIDKHSTFFNEDGSIKEDTPEWKETKWIEELKEILERV